MAPSITFSFNLTTFFKIVAMDTPTPQKKIVLAARELPEMNSVPVYEHPATPPRSGLVSLLDKDNASSKHTFLLL
jgi:hypothetical protein